MSAERTNPFDDEAGQFLVLVNARGEHSLWPEFAAVPHGWTAAVGPDSRATCLAYVEANWSPALRPTAA